MRQRLQRVLYFSLVAVFLTTSCATNQQEQQQQAAGGLIGGLAGAIIGAAVNDGDPSEGALIGAAIGAAVGWGATALYQYSSRQMYSQEQAVSSMGYQPQQGNAVQIQNAQVAPTQVNRGDEVKLTTDYSILAPAGVNNMFVTESWTLMRDGQQLYTVKGGNENRALGGWQAEGSIQVPSDASPGTYNVVHQVSAGGVSDQRTSTFTVL